MTTTANSFPRSITASSPSRKRRSDASKVSSSNSYRSQSTTDTFYRRSPTDANLNPELLHQALMPPSRFAGGDSEERHMTKSSAALENRSTILPSAERNSTAFQRRKRTYLDNGNNATTSTSMNNSSFARDTNQDQYQSGKRGKTRKKWSLSPFALFGADKQKKQKSSSSILIPIAVLLWYLLGVISISTTKVLLTDYTEFGMSPLFLTMQQLVIGFIFLRTWIFICNKKPPYPIPMANIISLSSSSQIGDSEHEGYQNLLYTAAFFTMGFLLTNLSFSGADASFVETVKASEPISSAGLAVLWGIEKLGLKEVYSLLGICVGVAISTIGNSHGSATVADNSGVSTFYQSLYSCSIVMGANLSFSFRGLFQKLFRASPNGKSSLIDDLNLQLRIHQLGIFILITPIIIFDSFEVSLFIGRIFGIFTSTTENGTLNFLTLSLVNGFAFAHYNLASSYILSRITVVHHAALNCIRRLFAIVVTSIIFSVPITMLSSLGVFISIGAFSLYIRFKLARKKKERMQLPLNTSTGGVSSKV